MLPDPDPDPTEPTTEPVAPAVAPPLADTSPEAVARQLRELFPALFGASPRPIKLRIQADIQERAPGRFTKPMLSAFLRRHTGGTGYLIALTKAAQRFDLDGQPAGELSEEHRKAAVEELARRRAIRAERDAQGEQARRARAGLLHAFETTTLTRANFCALKGIAEEALEAVLEQARREAAERARQMPPARPGLDRRPHPNQNPRGARR